MKYHQTSYLAEEIAKDPLSIDLINESWHHDYEAEQHVGYRQRGYEVMT
jgi:hypothetical protein